VHLRFDIFFVAAQPDNRSVEQRGPAVAVR